MLRLRLSGSPVFGGNVLHGFAQDRRMLELGNHFWHFRIPNVRSFGFGILTIKTTFCGSLGDEVYALAS